MSRSKRSAGRSGFRTALVAIGILVAIVRFGGDIVEFIQRSDAKTNMEKFQKEEYEQREKMLIGSLDHTKWLKRIEADGRVYGIEVLMKGGQKGVRTIYYPNPNGTSYCQLEQEFVASVDQEVLKSSQEIALRLDFQDEFVLDQACTEGVKKEQEFIALEDEKSARLSITKGSVLAIADFIRVDYEHDFVKTALNIVEKEYLPFRSTDAIQLKKDLKEGQLKLNEDCNIRIHKSSGVLSLITTKNATMYIGKFNKESDNNYRFTTKAWLTIADCDCEQLGVLQDIAFISAEGQEMKGDLEIVFEKGKDRIPAIRVL